MHITQKPTGVPAPGRLGVAARALEDRVDVLVRGVGRVQDAVRAGAHEREEVRLLHPSCLLTLYASKSVKKCLIDTI